MKEIENDKEIVELIRSVSRELRELNNKLTPKCKCGTSLNLVNKIFYYCPECDKEYFKCSECGEIKEADDLGESTLAQNYIICKECIHNGYRD